MIRTIIAAVLVALLYGTAHAQAPQTCGGIATVNPASATDTQIVAPLAGKNIFVCGIEASSNGSNNFYLESATAASCGGTLTKIGTTWYTAADWVKSAGAYIAPLTTGVGNGLCLNTSGTTALSVTVYYGQFP